MRVISNVLLVRNVFAFMNLRRELGYIRLGIWVGNWFCCGRDLFGVWCNCGIKKLVFGRIELDSDSLILVDYPLISQ